MFYEVLIGALALALGVAVGRLGATRRASAIQEQRAAEGLAYIRGVNFLLSGDPQKAIDEFIKAVQVNSETVEAYLVLGNLLRSQGDAARAIRLHQGVICRPGVSKEVLVQAFCELGLDYRECGMLDKARDAFQEAVKRDPKQLKAWVWLQEVLEELGNWEEALRTRERISKLQRTVDSKVVAHLLVELGKAKWAEGDLKAAKSSLKKAISSHEACVDAYLHLGDLYAEEGDDSKAVGTWKKVLDVAPAFTFLAYGRLEHAYYRLGQISALEELLRQHSDGDPFSGLFLARHLRKKGELRESARILEGIVQDRPGWKQVRKELIHLYAEQGQYDRALAHCQAMLTTCEDSGYVFQCEACGRQSTELTWRCPGCRRWDTIRPREASLEHVQGAGEG